MTLTRLALPSALALCAVVACGGSAFTSSSDGTGGATGGTNGDGGVSAKGGTVATGGVKTTGGTSAGGASATGGVSAAGGTKASGGTSAGGTVARGGSAGSATGGASSGGQTSYDACTASSQCTLVAAACCAACEPTKLDDFVAVNSSRANDYLASKPCINALCAPCLAPTPETTQSGNYGARCVSGHCQAFDVRTTELSKCENSADCVLRVGVRCCEGCSGGLAAVSRNANLQQALCGDPSGPGGAVACPACAPLLPSNASPTCSSGHCAVTWSGIATD